MAKPATDSVVKSKPKRGSKGTEQVQVTLADGKTRDQMLAELTLHTVERNALTAKGFAAGHCGVTPNHAESMKVITAMCAKTRTGNLDDLTDMLTAQALTLDNMFTEYGRRAMMNLGQFPDAVDRYTNLAAKAQNQCRTAIETLARVKRGGTQTVKVVHVYPGGQAVVADTVNNGQNGGERGGELEKNKLPHGQGAQFASLPGPDSTRDGVPLPCDAREEAVPAPRREIDGTAKGKPERLEARRPIEGDGASECVRQSDGAPNPQD